MNKSQYESDLLPSKYSFRENPGGIPLEIYNGGSGEIRTRASEETGALNQRLRPLGHATFLPND